MSFEDDAKVETVRAKIHEYDEIRRPEHYAYGGLEPWAVIAAWGLDYWAGNVVKYICRHKHKGGVKDLEKARAYLDEMIRQARAAT